MKRLGFVFYLIFSALFFGYFGACSGGGGGGGEASEVVSDAGGREGSGGEVKVTEDFPVDEGKILFRQLPFKSSFFFGTSIAGFQGDMGCPTLPAEECEDSNSDWYQWVTSKEVIAKRYKGLDGKEVVFASGDPPSKGPGQWELYAEDYRRLKNELRGNAFRFSFEWSRIFPSSTEEASTYQELKKLANSAALKKYHQMLAELKRLKITPFVTINHYTLPLWIHDGVKCYKDFENCKNRGWADPKRLIRELAKFAGFVAREFGGEVDHWLTINEPYAIVLPGYLLQSSQRVNPPALSMKFDLAKRVLIGMIEAHAEIYRAVKKFDKVDADGDGKAALVGIPYSFVPTYPKDPNRQLDVKGAQNLSYLLNYVFFNALVDGKLDANLDGKAADRPDLKGTLDFIGVNFYARAIVRGTKASPFPKLSPLFTVDILNLKDDYSYPKALYDILLDLHRRYKKPLIVTENGFGMPAQKKNGKPLFDDRGQAQFIVRHLFWIHSAIADGADVRGYFYWSLVDNYEWNHGMSLRFGLFAVDTDDPKKKRTPREGVAAFSKIAGAGAIPPSLLEKYLTEIELKFYKEKKGSRRP